MAISKLKLPSYISQGSDWSQKLVVSSTILIWVILFAIGYWSLSHVSKTIILLIIAILVAYALIPITKFFERMVPRSIAIAITYILVISCLVTFITFVFTTSINELVSLIQSLAILFSGQSGNQLSPLLGTFHRFGFSDQQINLFANQIVVQIEQLANSIIPILENVFTSIIDIIFVIALSIYFHIYGSRVILWFEKDLPSQFQSRFKLLIATLEKVVGNYIRGQLILSLSIGLLVGIGMAVLHVPYALLLGVLAFILEFVPIMGTIVSGLVCILLAISQGWLITLIVLVYFIIVHVLEEDVFAPRFIGKAVGLHPLLSIIALLIGTELYGIAGALLAFPISGIIQSLIVSTLNGRESA